MYPPKLIHMVWFGPRLPVQYELNIISFALKNPDFSVRLYLDHNVTVISQRLASFPNIVVLDYATVYSELEESNPDDKVDLNRIFIEAERTLPDGNFAAASDIFRLDLLYYFGGYYIDTDIRCIQSITPVPVPHGILTNTVYGSYNLRTGAGIINNLLISTAKANVVQVMREQLQLNYFMGMATMSTEDIKVFFEKRKQMLKMFVVATSGPSVIGNVLLKEPYATKPQHELIIPNSLLSNLYITCDNSWLPHGALSLKEREKGLHAAATKIQAHYRGRLSRKNGLVISR